jgi:hypothetical protein
MRMRMDGVASSTRFFWSGITTLTLLGCLIRTHAFPAFQRPQRHPNRRVVLSRTTSLASNGSNGSDGDGSGSYSDDMLRRIHFSRQEEYILGTNSLTSYNEQQQREQEEIKEWQDSFDRNGLSDFVPPISEGMNCLMVGDGLFGSKATDSNSNDRKVTGGHPLDKNLKLPWESEAQADITALRVLEGSPLTDNADDDGEERLVRTVVVSQNSNKDDDSLVPSNGKKGGVAMYDCIVDKGLMDAVLVLENMEAIRELVSEASSAIRELGIYVVVTRHLSAETKDYLVTCGTELGMEWQFDLDGITNPETTISVARRFWAEDLPPSGRLSRYRP